MQKMCKIIKKKIAFILLFFNASPELLGIFLLEKDIFFFRSAIYLLENIIFFPHDHIRYSKTWCSIYLKGEREHR